MIEKFEAQNIEPIKPKSHALVEQLGEYTKIAVGILHEKADPNGAINRLSDAEFQEVSSAFSRAMSGEGSPEERHIRLKELIKNAEGGKYDE